MSWTDLFKSKKGTPDPRIRWFGKLPTYADYYSSKTDASWAVEFNDWILKGYEVFHSRLAGDPKKKRMLPVGSCVIRLPKSEMTVLASIMDYGGDMRGRAFPMCFYVGVPTSQWSGPTSDHLADSTRVIRDLLALRREVTHFINAPGRFESCFGDREVDLTGVDDETADASWEREARAIRLDDWFKGAQSSLKIDDRETWFDVVMKWGDSIAAMESKSFEPTLRFPLSSGISSEVQLAGWIRWLEGRMDLARRSYSLLITGELNNGASRLSIVARDLLPDDFLLLSDVADTLQYVDDVCEAKVDESSVERAEPRAGAAEKDPRSIAGRLNLNGCWIDFAVTSAAGP